MLAVRELLDSASSRGFPRAAANLELALHCLHQARGSVPVRSGCLGADKSGQGIKKLRRPGHWDSLSWLLFEEGS